MTSHPRLQYKFQCLTLLFIFQACYNETKVQILIEKEFVNFESILVFTHDLSSRCLQPSSIIKNKVIIRTISGSKRDQQVIQPFSTDLVKWKLLKTLKEQNSWSIFWFFFLVTPPLKKKYFEGHLAYIFFVWTFNCFSIQQMAHLSKT